MAAAIDIYADISLPKAVLVKGLSDSGAFALGDVIQYEQLPIRFFPVLPTGNKVTGPFFSKVPLGTMALKAYVGPRIGVESLLASQTVFTAVAGPDADGLGGYFSGTINLNTTALNNALTADTLSTYLEFHLDRGDGVFSPIAQLVLTVIAGVKDPSGAAAVPAPATDYMTRAEMQAWALNMFVAWRNDLLAANAGRNLVLSSPDALSTRELGVANDKSPIDNAT